MAYPHAHLRLARLYILAALHVNFLLLLGCCWHWRLIDPTCLDPGPSRAELQSGRYFHNIASKALTPPSCLGGGKDANGGACLGSGAVGMVDLGEKVWPFIFTKALRAAGYKTGLFGLPPFSCVHPRCSTTRMRLRTDNKLDVRPTINQQASA